MKTTIFIIMMVALFSINQAIGQWTTSGSNIYNTNTGNVGIGNNSPTTLLHVAKLMTEPTITVQNLGGAGGATYSMIDNTSGAFWKFKATNTGGFKVRDQANALDVFVIESNSSANAIYINAAGSVGLGTSAPASSAALDVSSTTKGFLPPRMTQQQIMYIANPADGLIVYSTTDSKFYAFISSENSWKEVLFGSELITPFTCGSSISITHTAGNVAPASKSVSYGTVTNIPGEATKCWLTSNLGSDHQASTVGDNTEASAGWYWQFNRKQGYKYDGSRTPGTWILDISENSNWISSEDPCSLELGGSWRIPTPSEWNNVDIAGGWNNYVDPWESNLKMHLGGFLDLDGSLFPSSRGLYARFWANSQGASSLVAQGMIYDAWFEPYVEVNNQKEYGFSLRCIKD